MLTGGGSVAFGLLCKDGRELGYQWNRRFDDFTTSMFILGDELTAVETAIRLAASRPAAHRIGTLAYRAQ